MKTNVEYLETLKKLSESLKDQRYDDATMKIPTHWTVQKRERILDVDPYGSDGCICSWMGIYQDDYDFDTFKAMVSNRINDLLMDYDEDEDVTCIREAITKVNFSDNINQLVDTINNFVNDFGLNSYDWEVSVYHYRTEWKDIDDEVFLTKNDAMNYIKNYSHLYKDYQKPLRVVAHTANNSSDLIDLLNTLKNIDWNTVKINYLVNKDKNE